jgi:hypothetical protein
LSQSAICCIGGSHADFTGDPQSQELSNTRHRVEAAQWQGVRSGDIRPSAFRVMTITDAPPPIDYGMGLRELDYQSIQMKQQWIERTSQLGSRIFGLAVQNAAKR